MTTEQAVWSQEQEFTHVWHLFRSTVVKRKDTELMTKSLDVIAEVIRNPKHPFPQVADRPEKSQKNRYERRKVKQYIQLGDWSAEAKS